jgi:exodeoxyribonuclease I
MIGVSFRMTEILRRKRTWPSPMPSATLTPVRPQLNKYEFIGYDLEALGLRVQTDQPVQAGLVALCEDLKLLRVVNIKMVVNPYSVPGPKALEVTRLRLRDFTTSDRVPEVKAASDIRSILDDDRDDSKRVFFGYNFISFDEQMIRHMLFRNLISPYLTTGKNSRRLDLFPSFQYLHFVRPGLIHPGIDGDGKPSWRLSSVMKANGLAAEGAHDAVADMMFTSELLRLFSQRAKDVLTQMIELSDKAALVRLVESNLSGSRYLLHFTHFGMSEVTPMAPIVLMKDAGEKALGLDLSVPPREWINLTAQEIAEKVFEPGSPLRLVKLNTSPILTPSDDPTMTEALRREGYRTDHETYSERALLARRPDIVERFREAAKIISSSNQARFGGPKPVPEAQLYDGFMSRADRQLCERFHEVEGWGEKVEIVGKLQDRRLRSLGHRLIAMYAPEELQTAESYEALKEQYVLRLSGGDEIDDSVQTLAAARRELAEVGDPELHAEFAGMLDAYEERAHQEVLRLNAAIAGLADPPTAALR